MWRENEFGILNYDALTSLRPLYLFHTFAGNDNSPVGEDGTIYFGDYSANLIFREGPLGIETIRRLSGVTGSGSGFFVSNRDQIVSSGWTGAWLFSFTAVFGSTNRVFATHQTPGWPLYCDNKRRSRVQLCQHLRRFLGNRPLWRA